MNNLNQAIFKKHTNKYSMSKYRKNNFILRNCEIIKALRFDIVDNQDQIAKAITKDTGKNLTESMSQEVTAVLEMLKYFENNYPKWLKDKKIRYFRPGFWRKKNIIRYDPIGRIAIIGPSNYPFSIPVMQACAALICGNKVSIKPSEHAPNTNKIICELFNRTGFTKEDVSIIEGGPEKAIDLIATPEIKKVIFTGSFENGRSVAKLCGQKFKPCILELGGQGTAIICQGADLSLAARGLIWSSLYSNNNSCIGTKIIYIHKELKNQFSQIYENELLNLKASSLEFESTKLCLSDVNDFPFIKLYEFTSIEKTINEINSSGNGLGVSIWDRDIFMAKNIASKINAGLIWINDTSFGLPISPWGGNSNSGWGRLYSKESISELTNLKFISSEKVYKKSKLWWFPYNQEKLSLLRAVNDYFFGRKNKTIAGIFRIFLLLIKKTKSNI